jgi:hypothetical protein
MGGDLSAGDLLRQGHGPVAIRESAVRGAVREATMASLGSRAGSGALEEMPAYLAGSRCR